MLTLIKRVVGAITCSPESKAVDRMLSMQDIQPLLAVLYEGVIFHKIGRDYTSDGGNITVCNDIMGYEVKIRGGELIDCRPSAYGLTTEEGRQVYEAVLENIPGSTNHYDRLLVSRGLPQKHNTLKRFL